MKVTCFKLVQPQELVSQLFSTVVHDLKIRNTTNVIETFVRLQMIFAHLVFNNFCSISQRFLKGVHDLKTQNTTNVIETIVRSKRIFVMVFNDF